MKILVLGGTGAMGRYLVNLLAEQGNQVVVTSRTRTGRNGNIEFITGNAQDELFLMELLGQQWDAIVDFMAYSTAIFKSRYKYFLNASGHYIYLSSSRVYADSEVPLTESSPRLLDITEDKAYLETDEYALSKARQENILFSSPQKNWSIVRPYITYSDERLQLGVQEKEDWLYRALQGKSIVTSSDIQSKYTTLTFGADVAKGIASLIGRVDAHSEAFHITSNISISWSEVLKTYTRVLDSNLNCNPQVLLQNMADFMGWRAGKYQITYDRLYDRKFDNSKINKYVDTSTFISPKIGLSDCLKKFINSDSPQFKALDWKVEAKRDLLLGEYTSLTGITGLKQKAKYCIYRHLSFL